MLDLPAGANTVTIQAQDGSGNIATKAYSVNVLGVPATYTYDANGNLATKTEGADVWGYSFNALNELTAVTKNSVNQATYSYDPIGRRVERVAGATTTGWTYDSEDILRETVGTTITRFVHGPGADEPLAIEAATSPLTYLSVDGLGSIAKHTTATGAVANTLTYDAWGGLQSGTPMPYGFTGREWDSAAALYYYRARYFDPATGRFASQDPIRFRSGINFYAYVFNYPTGATDPTGLCTDCDPCPSGEWIMDSATVTGVAGFGMQLGLGKVTCKDNVQESRWARVGCVIYGPIVGASVGVGVQFRGTVHKGACRARDLPTIFQKGTIVAYAWAGASGDQSGNFEGGSGSYGPGMGFGWTDCVIKPIF